MSRIENMALIEPDFDAAAVLLQEAKEAHEKKDHIRALAACHMLILTLGMPSK